MLKIHNLSLCFNFLGVLKASSMTVVWGPSLDSPYEIMNYFLSMFVDLLSVHGSGYGRDAFF